MFNYSELKKYPREKDGVFSKLYVNRLSPILLYFIRDKKLSPNLISFFSFLLGLAGCLLFFSSSRALWIIAGLLLQFSFVVDGLDGSYARYTNQTSYYGAWFDRLFDRIVDSLSLIFMCLSFYIHYETRILFPMILGALTNFIFWVNYDTMTITGMFACSDNEKFPQNLFVRMESALLNKNIRLVFSRDVYLFFILLGAVFYNPYIPLLSIIILKNLNTFIKYYLYSKANFNKTEMREEYYA